MPTPSSGSTSYCTGLQLLQFVDERVIADLASDTQSPLSTGAIATNPNVTAALQAAAGWIESAATVGGAYTIDVTQTPVRNDLAAIVATGSNSAYQLMWLNAWLAYWMLWSRRPNDGEVVMPAKMALEWLDQLQMGRRILGELEVQQAGQVSDYLMQPQDYTNLNGPVELAGQPGHGFFGTRTRRFLQQP